MVIRRMSMRRTGGFTIIELMIVVAIVAVLATIAMPNLRDMVSRTRLNTAASDLHSALAFARSEAVKRNAAITVSPTGGGSTWSVGWQVLLGTTVLTTQDAYANSLAFTTKDASYASTLAVTAVTFSGTGRAAPTSTPSSANVAFIITAPGTAGTSARCVILDPSGRPAVRIDKNGNATDGCN